jgi:SAM-dependent methyltransferase
MKLCLLCETPFSTLVWHCPLCGYEPEMRPKFPLLAPELSSDEGFKDSYFKELFDLEACNFWFCARNKLILWALERYFPRAMSFLEIGCGTGFVLSGLATVKPQLGLFGSEISVAGLEYASGRVPVAKYFQMDARAIPFIDEFAVIGAFDVLEHIKEDQKVLNQMYRAVRPGGGILLTVPQHDFLWSRMDVNAHHVRRYDAHDLLEKVLTAGFKLERFTSFVSLLLPLMMVSRACQRSVKQKSDPLAELRIAGLANALLEKIMGIELLAIRRGFNFPLGGSLLLVARKEL